MEVPLTGSELGEIKISTRDLAPAVTLVQVEGEVDVYTSPKLKETLLQLIEAGKEHLLINLNAVKYVDSSGLGVLVGRQKELKERDGSIHLICTNQSIVNIFNLTGLAKIFGIYRDEADALKSLRSSPLG